MLNWTLVHLPEKTTWQQEVLWAEERQLPGQCSRY